MTLPEGYDLPEAKKRIELFCYVEESWVPPLALGGLDSSSTPEQKVEHQVNIARGKDLSAFLKYCTVTMFECC